jgi:AcrR family transcriptional regulator
MTSKSANTKQYIIETVAPVFNKYGYAGTSLSDITKATGLTKGAVYGNFQNKEEIAIEAFNYNIKIILRAIAKILDEEKSPVKKLFKLTEFFRRYQKYTMDFGGCPILNIGIDSKHQNPYLLERVRYSIEKIENYIAYVIEKGIELKEIKQGINSRKYAKRILALIEGSIFMMITMNNESYLLDMMDHIDKMIKTELIN